MTAELPTFVTAGQVAALCGYENAPAFMRQRKRLEEDHAFPLPMPTHLTGLRWRRDCVMAWVAEQGQAKAAPVTQRPLGPNVHLLAEARRA